MSAEPTEEEIEARRNFISYALPILAGSIGGGSAGLAAGDKLDKMMEIVPGMTEKIFYRTIDKIDAQLPPNAVFVGTEDRKSAIKEVVLCYLYTCDYLNPVTDLTTKLGIAGVVSGAGAATAGRMSRRGLFRKTAKSLAVGGPPVASAIAIKETVTPTTEVLKVNYDALAIAEDFLYERHEYNRQLMADVVNKFVQNYNAIINEEKDRETSGVPGKIAVSTAQAAAGLGFAALANNALNAAFSCADEGNDKSR